MKVSNDMGGGFDSSYQRDLLTGRRDNPYGFTETPNKTEAKAGVTPPKFFSMLNPDGSLRYQYSANPNDSAAFRKMSDISQSADLSPWAAMQMQQNNLSTSMQRDRMNAQLMGANDQAMQKLMSTGGGSNSGAAAFLAQQGQRDKIMGNQNIGSLAQQNALNIQLNDAQNKQNMLGQVANAETGAQAANARTAMQDTTGANLFGANRYHELMAAYGAEQTAQGQRDAANNSGGGGNMCCFIFLEARYGNGVMDEVVRRYRDEHVNKRNARGYYKLSEVLVPLMRKSKVVKFMVQTCMTTPLVMYAKAYYGKGSKLGFAFSPIKKFWLKLFDYLGQDHHFIRESGEVI